MKNDWGNFAKEAGKIGVNMVDKGFAELTGGISIVNCAKLANHCSLFMYNMAKGDYAKAAEHMLKACEIAHGIFEKAMKGALENAFEFGGGSGGDNSGTSDSSDEPNNELEKPTVNIYLDGDGQLSGVGASGGVDVNIYEAPNEDISIIDAYAEQSADDFEAFENGEINQFSPNNADKGYDEYLQSVNERLTGDDSYDYGMGM